VSATHGARVADRQQVLHVVLPRDMDENVRARRVPSGGGFDESRAQHVPVRKATQEGQGFDRLIALRAFPGTEGVCQCVEPLPVLPGDRNMMPAKDPHRVWMAAICRQDESCPPRVVGNIR